MRTDPFPAPANLVGGGVWLWGSVVAWLRRQGHETDDLGFPSMSDHTRIDSALIDLPASLSLPGVAPAIMGYVEMTGERAETMYAPSKANAHHAWADVSFQAEYALAV
ncbi:hypothetical protein [Nocardia salmonicida]|uniref:hypothetical protein n=1 Tax=Nocardia salmonicida TaxID=53431 RepID=UPI002E2B75C6|nr:hypothetical protein [Nocardia salmonicida]